MQWRNEGCVGFVLLVEYPSPGGDREEIGVQHAKFSAITRTNREGTKWDGIQMRENFRDGVHRWRKMGLSGQNQAVFSQMALLAIQPIFVDTPSGGPFHFTT